MSQKIFSAIPSKITSPIASSITGESNGGGGGDLSSVYPGAEYDFRGSQYSGSGNWINAITATGFDATLQGDPTFNTDLFELDGNDFFNAQGFSGTVVDSWHEDTNTGWTFIFTGKLPASGNTWLCGNTPGGGGNSGVFIFVDTNNRLRVSSVNNGSGNGSFLGTIGEFTRSADIIFIVSVDPSNDAIRYWINNDTMVESTMNYSGSGGTATGTLSFAAVDNGAIIAPNGTEARAFGLGSDYINDTTAQNIIDFYETDTGLTY